MEPGTLVANGTDEVDEVLEGDDLLDAMLDDEDDGDGFKSLAAPAPATVRAAAPAATQPLTALAPAARKPAVDAALAAEVGGSAP